MHNWHLFKLKKASLLAQTDTFVLKTATFATLKEPECSGLLPGEQKCRD
jgi:hypothetical protein